jgi:hypothetical protein
MSPDRYTQRSCYALGVALALAASTAFADASAPQQSVPEASVTLALADKTDTMAEARSVPAQYVYPSSEAGIRAAAAQGPVALHLYIYRTRMIYNYYIWDFATPE